MISIIIPTLNEEKVLEATLRNLRTARKVPHEVIISDGKSSDRTVEIARKYADHVLIYKGKERQTIAQGKNMGARRARGEYLIFIDADVHIPRPDAFFAKVLSSFNEHNRLVALTARIQVFPEQATLADRFFFWLLNTYHLLSNNILGLGAASGEFQVIKASAFREVGGYDERLVASEDYDMFVRLRKLGETRIEPGLVVFHTGRRAHAIGWRRLFLIWIANGISVLTRKRAVSKEWKPIR